MKKNPYLAGDGMAMIMPLLLRRVASEFEGDLVGSVLLLLTVCGWVMMICFWWRRENRLRQVEDPDEMVLHAIKWLRIYQLLAAGMAVFFAVEAVNWLLAL